MASVAMAEAVGPGSYGALVDTLPNVPFRRADALAAGFTPAAIRVRLDRGEWVALRRGIYLDAATLGQADERRAHALRVAGLLLALRPGAVACGTSAARILGLAMVAEPEDGIEVVVDRPSARCERHSDYVVHRGRLPDHHVVQRCGVPLTSPARTVFDLACRWSLADAVALTDSALRDRALRLDDLQRVLRDCHTRSGIANAHRVVGLADPRAESVLESLSRVVFYEQGLPRPRTQVVIIDDRGPFARVDFLWDGVKVIGEADGLGKYAGDGRRSTAEIVRDEKIREERLMDAGYEIIRWRWADVKRPERLAQRLRAAFARGVERQRGRRAA